MSKSVITSPVASQPVGPYSQAIRAGGHVYLAGQMGLDPSTGTLPEGGVAAQTRQVLANLSAVLARGRIVAGRARQDHGVHDRSRRIRRDEHDLRRQLFSGAAGALDRAGVALPMGAVLEIEAIAIARNG